MSVRQTWHIPRVAVAISRDVRAGMIKAGGFLEKKIKVSVSLPGPPASEAGEPPHKRSGQMRSNIGFDVSPDGMVLLIGMKKGPAPYGKWHEFGYVYKSKTGKRVVLPPRPFVRPAVAQNRAAVVKAIATARVKR